MERGYCVACDNEKCEMKQPQCPKYCMQERGNCFERDREGLADRNKLCKKIMKLECENVWPNSNKNCKLTKNSK